MINYWIQAGSIWKPSGCTFSVLKGSLYNQPPVRALFYCLWLEPCLQSAFQGVLWLFLAKAAIQTADPSAQGESASLLAFQSILNVHIHLCQLENE